MKASINEILTRNILIEIQPGILDTNKYGQFWKLIWDVVFTEGSQVLGHIRVESPLLELSDIAGPLGNKTARLHAICEEMRNIVEHAIDSRDFSPIQGPAKVLTLKAGT